MSENPVVGYIVRGFFSSDYALEYPRALKVIEELIVKGGLGLLASQTTTGDQERSCRD